MMVFKRKAYDKLLEWKDSYSDRYAALLEGPRRVGKSTIAEHFAKNEFDSYILIDFANVSNSLLAVFDDISNLDLFFLRLQAETGTTLVPSSSVIVFDEVQLAPKVRQAIKYLVKDGRYRYIETGSLISLKRNVKDIVIPSEEYRITVHPMDYEEFIWATGLGNFDLLRQIGALHRPVGNATNRTLMRNYRIYMAVGGMPQAVEAYATGKNFDQIDFVKREIIQLYMDDFRKIDQSGRLSAIYESIPAQLAAKRSRFVLSSATGRRKSTKDEELLHDLLSSNTVSICYNTTNPSVSLSQTKDFNSFKLYLADTGLFTTMLFNSEGAACADIYAKLLGDKLSADLGYLYENAVAQAISASGRSLYYHTWTPAGSTHLHEVDFLLTQGHKLAVFEVKSSNVNNHASIEAFAKKYSHEVSRRILFSQKDVGNREMLELQPIYLVPVILEEFSPK